MFKVCGKRPILNHLNLFIISLYAVSRYSVSQEVHFTLAETALLHFCVQIMLLQHLEDQLKVFFMLFHVAAVYQNIVDIHYHECVQERSQDVVHKRLKGHWRIGETERHHLVLIMAMLCSEFCFMNISYCHTDLVIS